MRDVGFRREKSRENSHMLRNRETPPNQGNFRGRHSLT